MLCLALLPRQRENYLWTCTIRAFRRKETADADERQIEQGKPSDWLVARFQELAPQDRDVTIEKMLYQRLGFKTIEPTMSFPRN